ncbi:tripartite tricarboxylate transporter substrate binding protein [Achromobacter sp. GG226]|uniref:Bug family tripartite tricarboxylate transporter substrate binding protein n=1 Tax=Verticiella alkaliphila TaxID=2779529 RepID=UPI001C0BFC78|nr:tripartite tricarboxylate transporter substrate binding protein [Verticiella sp. GG226]MBU4611107.1 tripartite tricarboxylate transporter substrate binding protein [Verticiella sp. GG226]
MNKRRFLSAAVAACALVAAAPTLAATYPDRPIRMIIPFPPGGTLDVVGRMLAQKLSEDLGQNVMVENRPGANGMIGADAVAKSAADGYTLLFSASTFTSAPMTMKTAPYSVENDFAPVALVAKAPLSVSINKDLPIKDVASLIKYGQANPGKLTFAVGSIGSAGHLSTELLKRAGKLDYLIIPYKGTAPAFQDLVGGRIDGFIDPILGAMSYHQSGMLRIVAVTSKDRVPTLPDVPTVAETVPGYEFYSWYGLWGPKGLAPEIVEKLNGAVNTALKGDMATTLQAQGLLMTPGSVDDFKAFQKQDMGISQKIITEGNIRVD